MGGFREFGSGGGRQSDCEARLLWCYFDIKHLSLVEESRFVIWKLMVLGAETSSALDRHGAV